MDTLQNQRRAMPTLSCPLINSLSQSLNMECLQLRGTLLCTVADVRGDTKHAGRRRAIYHSYN